VQYKIDSNILTLDRIDMQKKVTISSIHGGWGIRQRLNQLGLHVGSEIQIIRAGKFGGALLIRTSESDIALGRGLASHIQVNYSNEEK